MTALPANDTLSIGVRRSPKKNDLRDSGADLFGVYLTGANLTDADLYGVNLYGADLTGADLYGATLYGATLTDADLSGARINWQSHDLIAEVLKRAADDNVPRRMLAGLILISRDWCWKQFLALDIDTSVRQWALDELRGWVQDGDNAPDVLRTELTS